MATNESLCICGQAYDPLKFMILCDICKDWLHGSCIDLREHQSIDIDKFHCPRCELMCGPSIYKVRTNCHRHDYYETGADNKPVQTGTPVFLKELRSRIFENADDLVVKLRGQQLTLPYLAQRGWDAPILVDSTEGLDMQVPTAENFSVHDVENYVGHMQVLGSEREIDVIDVMRQRDIRMSMHDLASYFSSAQRHEVLNCISLEFSDTSLSALVEPPYIARKLCWVSNLWTGEVDVGASERPQVSKYCLISAAEAFTDFHVDFGGTSVWYHVMQGTKLFYLIRPTVSNLTLYQRWINSPSRSSTFFGDQVDACYQLTVKASQTLLIPAGWIHAVLTPVDSLVFGGNFLCSLHVPMQLRIYELEKKCSTPYKFRFPSFEACHWLGGRRMVEEMNDFIDANQRCPAHLVLGARALVAALRVWAHDAVLVRRSAEPVPPCVAPSKLIKQLSKALRCADKLGASTPAAAAGGAATGQRCSERESRRAARPRPLADDFVDISERAQFESLLVEADQRAATRQRQRRRPASARQPLSPLKLTVPRPRSSPAAGTPPPAPPGPLRIRLGARLTDDEARPPLTIDECPRVGRVRSASLHQPLKLRLSLNGSRVGRAISNPDSGDPAAAAAGTNNGIEELLRASTVTDQQLSGVSPAAAPSPSSTRDAIVGMLSMSRAAVLDAGPSPAAKRRRRSSLSEPEDEEDEPYGPPHDDDYVYPTLGASDDDEQVFKSRGRRRQDETWSPKARVQVCSVRGARPNRDGARRETIDRELGQTPARDSLMANKRTDWQEQAGPSVLDNDIVDESVSNTATPTTATKRSKPKKGMATVKQRLGKILKMHKMKF